MSKDWRCEYCKRFLIAPGKGAQTEGRAATVDHKTPKSRGGSHHDPHNTALVCNDCNLLKGDLTLEEFTAGVAFLEASSIPLQRTKRGVVAMRHMTAMKDFAWPLA